MAYLLDANVFIESKKRHYAFDICPGFWSWLDDAHANGKVLSIEKVADELELGTDELVAWAKASRGAFFLEPNDATIQAGRRVGQLR